jgi:hypothetical protein
VTRKTSTDRPYFIDVADIEGDHDMDILVGHRGGGHFDLFVNGTNGIPQDAVPLQTLTLGFENQAGRLADFDRDGRLDAVIATGQGRIAIHKGNGDGTFGGDQDFEIVGSQSQVALDVGDLDGDNDPDIVVSERHSPVTSATPDKLTVLINRTPPPVTTTPGGPGSDPELPGGGGPSLPSPAGPPPSPITGLKALKSTATVDRRGRVTLGTATNPPTASTTQTLTTSGAKAAATRQTLGRDTTRIPAGTTRKIVLKLSAKALKRLKRARTLRVTLSIKATSPSGQTATVTRKLKLKAPRR